MMSRLTNRKFAIYEDATLSLKIAQLDEEREKIEHEKVMSTLLIDVAIYHAEADIRWLRHCEAKLKELID